MKIDYKELYMSALDSSKNAYCPYSNFHVGAALMTASGAVYTGVNVENSSYGAAICAERSAIAAAVSSGERNFIALAVASPEGDAKPCGICRQVLFEFGGSIKVVTGADAEHLEIEDSGALLPKGFKL